MYLPRQGQKFTRAGAGRAGKNSQVQGKATQQEGIVNQVK